MPPEATHSAENSENNRPKTTMEDVPLDNIISNAATDKKNTASGHDDDEVDYVDIDPEALSFEDQASVFSKWFLFYLTPLLKLGSTKILDSKDVGPPSKCDRAKSCYDSVNALWIEEVERAHEANAAKRIKHEEALVKCGDNAKKLAKLGSFTPAPPNLAKVLWNAFGKWKIIWAMALYVLSSLLQFLPVLILTDLVRYFESGAPSNYRALLFHPWGDVVGLLVFPLLVALLQTRSQVIFNHCAIFIRTSVSNLLFSKALTISAAGRAQTSTGQVVNMMSNDTTQLQRFLQFVGFTLVAPIQIIVALVLIYQQVGNATWVGVGFMFCLIPINGIVFSTVSKQRRKVLKYSDARVKMVNEVLAGIRIIKFYAWEKPFGKELNRLRDKELKALTKLAYTSAVGFSLIMLSAPIINPILVFLVYINTESVTLDAATAFTTIALFNIMRFPFAFLPMGFLQYVQSKIALKRLSRYLELSELTGYVLPNSPPTLGSNSDDGDALALTMDENDDEKSDPAIILDGGSFSWVDPDATPVAAKPQKPKRMSRKERRASLKAENDKQKQKEEESKTGSINGHPSNASLNRAESLASLGVSIRTVDSEEENTREARIALKNIACSIERGSLVAVVGSVGSGKSSFLSAILGEMESIDGGKVYMPLKDGEKDEENLVSYCSQSPWVVNDTLRGNILFGRPYEKDRYDEVVGACALLDDLAVLPAGDKTEIGERGINLSGGQKARISLARAMYSQETQLMLLDDPLSAVDAHVGEHLFKHAITGMVSNGTTRVLVTHHVHFLPRCDKVIMLEKGEVKHIGSYPELVARGVDFAGAVDVSKKEDEAGDKDEEKQDDSVEVEKPEKSTDATKAEGEKLKMAGEKLVKDEEQMEGAVEGSMYTHYAKAGGVFAFISVFVIQGVGRASEIMGAFWLSIWADATAQSMMTNNPMSTSQTNWYLNIYAAFGIGGVLCLTFRAIAMAIHRLRASKRLHDSLTESILRAPVAFFDVTPIGRVLNRFAADMDKIDLELTNSLGQAVSTMFSVLGAVGAIIVATNGTLLVAFVPIGYINYL